jgi:GTPase SAR1 family protein
MAESSTTSNGMLNVAPESQAPVAPESDDLYLPFVQDLQSAEQMKLLDAIDSLRAVGIGEFTALPQLVVCGDQSSGKSSVLEAISGVPFPRKADVCTRFATEVSLRRAPRDSMSVSIVPSPDASPADRQRLLGFRRAVYSKGNFAKLFEEAKQAMGLTEQKKSFSKNLLKVEFFGPKQPQLTLVDLPGLIHSRTGGQEKSDIILVKELVSRYLSSERSIILAVIAASNDYGNQEILEMIREVDPHGRRALGIITKPDIIEVGEEGPWIKLARNEDVKFDLGWHVVKNLKRGTEDRGSEVRDEEETDFFQGSNFSILPSRNVGISRLRTRLSKVLFNQIRTELPRLLEDIERCIKEAKGARDRLGEVRTCIGEQRKFLIDLSESFHQICRDAIGGHYDHAFFQSDRDIEVDGDEQSDSGGAMRLCAVLRNKYFKFAKDLRKKGAAYNIVEEGEDEGDREDDESDDDVSDQSESDDENKYKTREWAIKHAYKLLKRTRGSEVSYGSTFLDHIRDADFCR